MWSQWNEVTVFLARVAKLHSCAKVLCVLFHREMWWLLLVLFVLLVLFCTLDVWYFLRAAFVVFRAWLQPVVRDVTGEQTVTGLVTTRDIDLCHMNNARYLRECDFARFSLYMRNGVFKALRHLRGTMVVGATTIRYRRALCIGEGFELRSRIVTWDDKAFYLEQRFVSTKDGLVCAVMYCKQTLIRTSPDQILQHLCKRKVRSKCTHIGDIVKHLKAWTQLMYLCVCRSNAPSFQRTFSTGWASSPPAARP